MTPDIEAVAALIREAAETEILPRFRRLAAGEVSEKAPGDFVTAADLAVEAFLEVRLGELAPGSLVVGEEAVHKDPDVLAHLAGERSVWIIDPIDGTYNFAHGDPLFAVQVAYVVQGETRAAWIHDPVGARTAMAEARSGAFMDGSRLKVAAPDSPERMAGTLYAGANRPGLAPDFAEKKKRYGTRAYRRCVGHEYLSLATGEMHFALFTRLLPWDHAPGQHLHWEAGGFSALVDRQPYRPTLSSGYILLAPDRDSWESLHALFVGE